MAGDEDADVGGMDRVAAGLRLVGFGLVAVVVNAGATLGVWLSLGGPFADPTTWFETLGRDHPGAASFLIGLGVLSSVLGIAGQALCLAVPSASQATPLIAIALLFSAGGLAMGVVGGATGPGEAAAELTRTSPFLSAIGAVFFLRFLRRLAVHLKSPRLSIWAARLLAGTLALVLVAFATLAGFSAGFLIVLILVPPLLLAALTLFAIYGRLVFGLMLASAEAAKAEADGGD